MVAHTVHIQYEQCIMCVIIDNILFLQSYRSRFLRNNDRSRNAYPRLHYPEIYLLQGGYKNFYESYPELCDPIGYRQMLDPMFTSQCHDFRAVKSKSSGDPKSGGRSIHRLVRTKSRNLTYLE